MFSTRLAVLSTSSSVLVPPYCCCMLTESVDERANGDERREHPVAELVEGVGELVGSPANVLRFASLWLISVDASPSLLPTSPAC